MPHPTNVSLVLAVLLSTLVGCDSRSEAEHRETVTKTMHACTITLATVEGEPEVFEGSANGTNEKAVEDEAWKNACAALPEADRDSCRDRSKFAWSLGGGSAESGGVKNFSATVKLTRVVKPKEFEGSAESETSADAACTEALSKACEAAGATGDCVAAGTHEQRGRRSSKETRTAER